jgi:hypothetical protein
MTEQLSKEQEVAELRRLLGWVYHRSRHGCFSFKRSQRDGALSDINYWTADFAQHWQPPGGRAAARDRIWCGESP